MYRYQLERYRGRSTRHVCPQCGRKNVFTRYVDTENNNIYISDKVGKCNRLDKCGYHYTPHQYFTDNPWKRDAPRKKECSFIHFYRENERMNSTPPPPPEPKRQCAGLPARGAQTLQTMLITTTNYPFLPNTPKWGLRFWRVDVAISRALCHPECNEGSPRLLHAINAGCLLSASRRFFTSFRMTAYGVQDDNTRQNYPYREHNILTTN